MRWSEGPMRLQDAPEDGFTREGLLREFRAFVVAVYEGSGWDPETHWVVRDGDGGDDGDAPHGG